MVPELVMPLIHLKLELPKSLLLWFVVEICLESFLIEMFFFLSSSMKTIMGEFPFGCYLFCLEQCFLSRVITEEEFIRGCMADRVLYQMLTADTGDSDR